MFSSVFHYIAIWEFPEVWAVEGWHSDKDVQSAT